MDSVSANVIPSENYSEDYLDSAVQSVSPVEQTQSKSAPLASSPKFSKAAIRTSLKASTLDGVFAVVFSNVTGGALLSNFLLELGANSTEVGLLTSIPMLANLLQPLGAYFSERTTSRHLYCLWIYGLSRSLWLVLASGIAWMSWGHGDIHSLLIWTLGVTLLSHGLGALGSASWLSWMAVLVPRRLRGRYFGIRNSAANLVNLLSVPLMGLIVANWYGGSLQGYGIVLILGIASGLISLAFQNYIVDVNPQLQRSLPPASLPPQPSPTVDTANSNEPEGDSPASLLHDSSSLSQPTRPKIWQDANFLIFLLYLTLWTFSVNLSAPFFNLYMLDDLGLDISQVTLYNSLTAAANLLMLVLWGKLADRIGNRPILVGVGILVAVTPLLWLSTGANPLSIWLWLPLLHILSGGTWAAIDLGINNLQIGVAPIQSQAAYFGMVAAVTGVAGALGTTAGGFLAESESFGGILGLFALSGVLRLGALLPLIFVHEQRSQSLGQMMRLLFPLKLEADPEKG